MRWFIIMFVALGCSAVPAQEVTKIDNAQLIELMKQSDMQLVDIRTPEEVAEGIIEGAQLIDFFDEDFDAQMSELDKEKPLIIYCRSGGRSGKAAGRLATLGFKEIYDVSGGFNGWKTEGRPVTKP